MFLGKPDFPELSHISPLCSTTSNIMVRKSIMWLVILAGIGFLIAGPKLKASAKKLAERAEQARNWPIVSGTVMSSSVGKASSSESFYPVIHYKYNYSGKEFESDQVYLGLVTYTDPEKVTRIVSVASAGKPIKIYVNPNLPSDAVLSLNADISTDGEATALMCYIIGPILILLGGFGLLQIRRYAM